ncbi:MAG: hypothetical protein EOP06_24805 [Proteobacteria bacterium]|nr:MAG: hypothetical protein EOP06_24805 [Pseudomonadota bacterium]
MEMLFHILFSFALAGPVCNRDSSDSLGSNLSSFSSVSQVLESNQLNRFAANPVAFADGPNCFNAALFGKGYVGELTHTSSIEFAFFLEKFCQEVNRPATSGDIVTVKRNDTYAHAALALSNGSIFEKLSSWGSNSQVIPPESDGRTDQVKANEEQERKASSQYNVRPIKSSKYFNEEQYAGPGTRVSIFSCKDSRAIKKNLASLNAKTEVSSILKLNKKLETLIFDQTLDPKWRDSLAQEITTIAAQIKSSKLTGDNRLFLFAKAKSLFAQLFDLNSMSWNQSTPSYFRATTKLSSAIESLETQVRSDKGEVTRRILRVENSN